MRYRPETNSLKWSYFSVRRLQEKGWGLIGDAGTSVQNETDDLWLTGSIVGVLRWICICCHSDFTQLNLYSSLSDGAELGGGGLMRWNTCKCLLFEEQLSLGTPPPPLCVCAHLCCAGRKWKLAGALSSLFFSVWRGGNYNFSGGFNIFLIIWRVWSEVNGIL